MGIKYSRIRNNLRTGDLILFSGRGFISWIIQKFTRSRWSHIGMIIKESEFDMTLLWESTTLSKIKTIHGEEKRGVAIRPLSEVVNGYKGIIGLRLLRERLTEVNIETLKDLRKEFKNKDYERSTLELFRSAYDWVGGSNRRDLSSVFCSELVAEAYQRFGFLTLEIPSNEYTPSDFESIELVKNKLAQLIVLEKG
jgi:hypothetical protein